MLLNEFLKEHRNVQEVEKDLRATIAKQQQKQIEALTVGLKKVATQIESGKAVVPVAMNDR